MTTMLTPELSEQALESFRTALGSDAVITDEAGLREFRDPFAFSTWDDYTASAVVMPQTVEEIQEIVRIANEHKVRLWTHGAGHEQRLRRAGPAAERLGDRQPAEDEPRARDRRGVRVRGRRAGRPLVRPLRRDQGRRAQADGLGRPTSAGAA